jgi:hypothetical protein
VSGGDAGYLITTEKRLKGLEPSTFCMASRRSSQLSYSRKRGPEYTAAPAGSGAIQLLPLLHVQLL